MAIYVQKKDGDSFRWVDKETGALCPESMRVAVTKLSVGDIVLIGDWGPDKYSKRSAVITAIEKHPEQTCTKRWKITTVDSVGKVDVFELGHGRSGRFERQCSQETKDALLERDCNIRLRRGTLRLEKAVHCMLNELNSITKNGSKNPKMHRYQECVARFALDLDTMYDDLGSSLGLPSRVKKTK